MYRQVRVTPKHANFQSILWQPLGENQIQRYKLETVTFGTANAPFQAIRALHEMAHRVKHLNPIIAANILLKFYVDDYLGCEKTVKEKPVQFEKNSQEYWLNLVLIYENGKQAMKKFWMVCSKKTEKRL